MAVHRFNPCADSVREARRFVVHALPSMPSEQLEVLLLMVSELVTSALVNSATDFVLSVEESGGRVRVEVSGTGGGDARLPSRGGGGNGSAGLFLVERLSESWGVTPANDGAGKTLWFSMLVAG